MSEDEIAKAVKLAKVQLAFAEYYLGYAQVLVPGDLKEKALDDAQRALLAAGFGGAQPQPAKCTCDDETGMIDRGCIACWGTQPASHGAGEVERVAYYLWDTDGHISREQSIKLARAAIAALSRPKVSEDEIKRALSGLQYLSFATPPCNQAMDAVRSIRAALTKAGLINGGEDEPTQPTSIAGKHMAYLQSVEQAQPTSISQWGMHGMEE